ncbi:hypothetical protein DFS34DRAFT_647551 [Phlyctochytrium arcticum]|nr:hypothetical protein DFS34DRAFT_647551 [Phlyctochytrium arcticum]
MEDNAVADVIDGVCKAAVLFGSVMEFSERCRLTEDTRNAAVKSAHFRPQLLNDFDDQCASLRRDRDVLQSHYTTLLKAVGTKFSYLLNQTTKDSRQVPAGERELSSTLRHEASRPKQSISDERADMVLEFEHKNRDFQKKMTRLKGTELKMLATMKHFKLERKKEKLMLSTAIARLNSRRDASVGENSERTNQDTADRIASMTSAQSITDGKVSALEAEVKHLTGMLQNLQQTVGGLDEVPSNIEKSFRIIVRRLDKITSDMENIKQVTSSRELPVAIQQFIDERVKAAVLAEAQNWEVALGQAINFLEQYFQQKCDAQLESFRREISNMGINQQPSF